VVGDGNVAFLKCHCYLFTPCRVLGSFIARISARLDMYLATWETSVPEQFSLVATWAEVEFDFQAINYRLPRLFVSFPSEYLRLQK